MVSTGYGDDDGRGTDAVGGDPDTQRLLDTAFPERPLGGGGGGPVYAVIPESVIQSSPEEFSTFLESVFEDTEDLDAALERWLTFSADAERGGWRAVRAVIPSDVLRRHGSYTAEFLSELFAAFDEIEAVLVELQEKGEGSAGGHGTARAVVPDGVVADPAELSRAIEEETSESLKLEFLVRQAKHALKRLSRYRITRRTPGEVIGEMRRAGDLRTLQYVVEFLWSIHVAAASFEQLELPKVHIRDYLEHLYRMEDWEAMAGLVKRLERAVIG